MNINKKYIESEIEKIVESLGFLFIDLVIRGDNRQYVFEVFVDNETGITAENCADISRVIHDFFELHSEEIPNYRLDVSSPGIERPLKYLIQYKKHVNRDFQIKYEIDNETKKQKGSLIEIQGENLLFRFGKEELLIPFVNIKEAKVQISF